MPRAASPQVVVPSEKLSGPNSFRSQTVKALLRELDWAKHTKSTKWSSPDTTAGAYEELAATQQLLRFRSSGVIGAHDARSLRQVGSVAVSNHSASDVSGSIKQLHLKGSEVLDANYLRKIGYDRASDMASMERQHPSRRAKNPSFDLEENSKGDEVAVNTSTYDHSNRSTYEMPTNNIPAYSSIAKASGSKSSDRIELLAEDGHRPGSGKDAPNNHDLALMCQRALLLHIDEQYAGTGTRILAADIVREVMSKWKVEYHPPGAGSGLQDRPEQSVSNLLSSIVVRHNKKATGQYRPKRMADLIADGTSMLSDDLKAKIGIGKELPSLRTDSAKHSANRARRSNVSNVDRPHALHKGREVAPASDDCKDGLGDVEDAASDTSEEYICKYPRDKYGNHRSQESESSDDSTDTAFASQPYAASGLHPRKRAAASQLQSNPKRRRGMKPDNLDGITRRNSQYQIPRTAETGTSTQDARDNITDDVNDSLKDDSTTKHVSSSAGFTGKESDPDPKELIDGGSVQYNATIETGLIEPSSIPSSPPLSNEKDDSHDAVQTNPASGSQGNDVKPMASRSEGKRAVKGDQQPRYGFHNSSAHERHSNNSDHAGRNPSTPFADSRHSVLDEKAIRSKVQGIYSAIKSVVYQELSKQKIELASPAWFNVRPSPDLAQIYRQIVGRSSVSEHRAAIEGHLSAPELACALVGVTIFKDILGPEAELKCTADDFITNQRTTLGHFAPEMELHLRPFGTNLDTILRRTYLSHIRKAVFQETSLATTADIFADRIAALLQEHLQAVNSYGEPQTAKNSLDRQARVRWAELLCEPLKDALVLKCKLSSAREDYRPQWFASEAPIVDGLMHGTHGAGEAVASTVFPGLTVERDGVTKLVFAAQVKLMESRTRASSVEVMA